MTLRILDEAFANGATDIQACFIAKISTESLYAYQREHPEYTERKQALKDMIAYQAKQVVKEDIMNSKTETAKWYLERKDKEFKQRTDITTDDKSLTVNLDSIIANKNDINGSTKNNR